MKTQVLTLKQLSEAKKFSKENSMVDYMTPAQYLNPFLIMAQKYGADVRILAEGEIKNINNDDTENIAYARIMAEATLKLSDEMFYEIGMIVACDLSKPIIKVYQGPRVKACMNLCVFQAADVQKYDLFGNGRAAYTMAEGYFNKTKENIERCVQVIEGLKRTPLSQHDVERFLGKALITSGMNKLISGTRSITEAALLLSSPKSKYFYKNPEFNAWMLYNSMTDYFGGSSPLETPEKALAIFSIMKEEVPIAPEKQLSLIPDTVKEEKADKGESTKIKGKEKPQTPLINNSKKVTKPIRIKVG